jgi:hypothetical protein
LKGGFFFIVITNPKANMSSTIAFDSHKELPGEHIVVMNKTEKLAALRKNMVINKGYKCVDLHWPFMRVKNTIHALNLRKRPPLRSHYDCLVFLASLRGLTIEQLVQMDLRTYLGNDELYLKIRRPDLY